MGHDSPRWDALWSAANSAISAAKSGTRWIELHPDVGQVTDYSCGGELERVMTVDQECELRADGLSVPCIWVETEDEWWAFMPTDEHLPDPECFLVVRGIVDVPIESEMSDRDIALDAIAKLARCRGEMYEVLRAAKAVETIDSSSIEAVLRETAGEDDWPEWTSEWHTKADDERFDPNLPADASPLSINVNLNAEVRFKLTEAGQQVWSESIEQALGMTVDEAQSKFEGIEINPEKSQLWVLFSRLGHRLFNGGEQLIEDNAIQIRSNGNGMVKVVDFALLTREMDRCDEQAGIIQRLVSERDAAVTKAGRLRQEREGLDRDFNHAWGQFRRVLQALGVEPRDTMEETADAAIRRIEEMRE